LIIVAASFSSNSAAIECRSLGLQHYWPSSCACYWGMYCVCPRKKQHMAPLLCFIYTVSIAEQWNTARKTREEGAIAFTAQTNLRNKATYWWTYSVSTLLPCTWEAHAYKFSTKYRFSDRYVFIAGFGADFMSSADVM
jgi:hypothetical protein